MMRVKMLGMARDRKSDRAEWMRGRRRQWGPSIEEGQSAQPKVRPFIEEVQSAQPYPRGS
jgi:hypothetical protein